MTASPSWGWKVLGSVRKIRSKNLMHRVWWDLLFVSICEGQVGFLNAWQDVSMCWAFCYLLAPVPSISILGPNERSRFLLCCHMSCCIWMSAFDIRLFNFIQHQEPVPPMVSAAFNEHVRNTQVFAGGSTYTLFLHYAGMGPDVPRKSIVLPWPAVVYGAHKPRAYWR